MAEISSKYNPKEVEDKWYKFWEENNFFHAEKDTAKKPYCIVIPPPNITGILHMGHALNNTLQDILIRYKKMQGFSSMWMPGTDHAGIATQNVVERKLAEKGLKRHELGREEFLKQVWQWREEYGSTIIKQLKKLGASCDWPRTRFTMDEGYSQAVQEVFIKLYQKGLIYRGNYIINWCPRCQTALSDEEAQHRSLEGFLYYIKYPLKTADTEYIIVATTRPETMLGDTAVAANPKDRRYKKLKDKIIILPILNREIKVIYDELVDPKFGTGIVKVTPAHDPNDFEMGMRHKLEFINVMNPDGTMNKEAGEYAGMDRFECREALLEDLKERKLLLKVEPHAYSAGHCYRCHTIIEPYLSKQWFVKMKPLAKAALDVVKTGKIKFYPKRWTKVYTNWMENIRDWCISRQIWWGHRLPVYYCKSCQSSAISYQQGKADSRKLKAESSKGIIVSRIKPEKCPDCGSGDIYQDEDVLDTWFSSWLWPFATFGWPFQPSALSRQPSAKNNLTAESRKLKAELAYFYPTSALVTAQEIIFFWVARMIMAGMEFMGDIPFRDVYIHGTVRDATGTKMSKSLGNIIDPLEVIEQYGSDALRFSLISITAVGQDVFLSKEKFEAGRNFANKLWNASRFVLMNKSDQVSVSLSRIKKENFSLADRWILSRLNHTVDKVTICLEAYKFNEASNLLYEFIWHEFCDWYLELIKPVFTDSVKQETVQAVVIHVLEKALRLIHPFMPFISEEIWQKLPHEGDSIMTSSWPETEKDKFDPKAQQKMSLIMEVIAAIRNLRLEVNVPPNRKSDIIISSDNQKEKEILEENISYLVNLAKIENCKIDIGLKKPKSSVTCILNRAQIFMPLEGLIDLEVQKKKLEEQIKENEAEHNRLTAQLKNKEFVKKAPVAIVEKIKMRHTELKQTLDWVKNNLKQLG